MNRQHLSIVPQVLVVRRRRRSGTRPEDDQCNAVMMRLSLFRAPPLGTAAVVSVPENVIKNGSMGSSFDNINM